MDVNEEIITAWLQLCKEQFVMENITFKVIGPKRGSNYSNIDILAVDKNGKYYDYEIKWRSVYSISATDNETPEKLIYQMNRNERVQKIKEIIGNKKYEKVFITTHNMFGKKESKRKEFEKLFRKNGIEILYFDDIIPELVNKIEIKGKYDSEVLQTIRMMKYFKLIN